MCFPWGHLFMHKELGLNHWLCSRKHQTYCKSCPGSDLAGSDLKHFLKALAASEAFPWSTSHFLEAFPASEDVLAVVMPVWLFWEPGGCEGGFFLSTGVLFLLLNTLLGSSLFTKESASSDRSAVLIVMGLYMLNHCWKAGWWGKTG